MQSQVQNEIRVAGLGRFDRVYSVLHQRWVRFLCWEDSTWAEVADSDSCEPLPDLVHREQLRAY